MATLDEKVAKAERELEDKRRRRMNELDRDKELEVQRIRSLRHLVTVTEDALPQFVTDPAIRDMLTNIKREAEGLLQKEFDKYHIPA